MWIRLLAFLLALASWLCSGCAPSRVAVQVSAPPKPADDGEVVRLIDALTGLESFDTGLSTAFGGSDFPPVAGQGEFHVGRSGHGLIHGRLPALTRLVELGPHALPALLAHLDDKRPTKLEVKHEGFFGGMWHAQEVPVRSDNQREAEALQKAGIGSDDDDQKDEEDPFAQDIDSHRVTVGDVCFVIAGMITNRPYNAVRYQPTACQVINSPTSSPAIAATVRGMWEDSQLPDDLFERLAADFESEDPLSTSAATRLIYYFHSISGPLILKRLQALEKRPPDDRWELHDLLRAVSWSTDPGIREWITKLVLRTDDSRVISNGAPALGNPEQPANLRALLRLADTLKGRSDYDDLEAAREVLRVAMTAYPDQRDRPLERFLAGAAPADTLTVVEVCYQFVDLPVAPLTPLLDDNSAGYGHYLIAGQDVLEDPDESDYLTYRVCDNVYELISRLLGDRKTKCTGTRDEMDRRIESLKTRLQADSAGWPFSADEIAARQRDQDKVRLALEKRRARIEQAAGSQEEQWALTALDPTATHEEVQTAAASLLAPQEWKEPRITVDQLLWNPPSNKPLRRDALGAEQQTAVGEALAEHLQELLAGGPAATPSQEALDLACLLMRWNPKLAHQELTALAGLLEHYPNREGVRPGSENHFFGWSGASSKKFTRVLHLLDNLLRNDFPGAGRTLRAVFENSGFALLADTSHEDVFLRLLGDYPENPEVDSVLRAMFADPTSPWHLSKCSCARAGSYGNAELLESVVFRKALREALHDERVEGALSIKADDPDYCWIEWTTQGSSGQGVGSPLGVKPGGPSMPVRHCDALLEGVANAVFARNPGPEFHIYWPLKNREKSRKAWIAFLEKRPAPSGPER